METYTLRDGRTILLRPPTKEDAAACIAYLKTVGGETDYLIVDGDGIPGLTETVEAGYLSMSVKDPGAAMFLGFVDGELVTVFDVRAQARPRIWHNGTISVTVLKDYWHLGIGTLCMTRLLTAAAEMGLKNLNLEVNANNARAIELYTRFGFREIGRHEKRYWIRGEYQDELLMDLSL